MMLQASTLNTGSTAIKGHTSTGLMVYRGQFYSKDQIDLAEEQPLDMIYRGVRYRTEIKTVSQHQPRPMVYRGVAFSA